MESSLQPAQTSLGAAIAGWIISLFITLFLVFDGVTKIMMVPAVLQAMQRLGYPDALYPVIGTILLVCTALYLIPRTAILGAVLLTGYLGGAVASQLRISSPPFELSFPLIIGALAWIGLYLRDSRARSFLSAQPL
jgi:hypothetical protein